MDASRIPQVHKVWIVSIEENLQVLDLANWNKMV